MDKNKKTVIFDFGNILIDLDYPKCFQSFDKVLGVDFSEGVPDNTKEILHKFDRGHINVEGFLWHLQQYNPEAEIRDVIAAWNSILGQVPLERFQMVEQLRGRYNVVMLSNINELHIEYIHKDLKKRLGIEDFHTAYFDKVYYSCRIGMRKPDEEIYSFVQKDLGIPPSDILFIDDMSINIAACKKSGWHGMVHDTSKEIIDEIDDYLSLANF